MRNSLHLDSFCEFWEMNFSSPVPPLPQKPEALTVTQAEPLRVYDGGKLYQTLFKLTPQNQTMDQVIRNRMKYHGKVD